MITVSSCCNQGSKLSYPGTSFDIKSLLSLEESFPSLAKVIFYGVGKASPSRGSRAREAGGCSGRWMGLWEVEAPGYGATPEDVLTIVGELEGPAGPHKL